MDVLEDGELTCISTVIPTDGEKSKSDLLSIITNW